MGRVDAGQLCWPTSCGEWDELCPIADEWRDMRAFPPKVAVPDDAPLQDRLLGLTGRDSNAA